LGLFGSPQPTVTIADPHLVKEVIKKINEYPKEQLPNGFFKTLLGGDHSLIRINNPTWHDHRVILNKAFTSNKVFFEPMERKVLQCVARWKGGEPVSVEVDLQKMTLDVLATCIFGNDFNTLNGDSSEPLAAYNYCKENAFSFLGLIISNYSQLPLPFNVRWKKEMAKFDAYCHSIIEQAKKSMEVQENTTEENTKSKSLVALMIEGGMMERYIQGNVRSFFIAGHETTTASLLWVIGLIAKNQDVQAKARKEVLENIKNGFKYETLKDLNYLDWIIHETMRFYPIVPAITQRYAATATTIGNFYIPEKTIIQLDFVSILHDKEIWGDPENFRPERFDPEILTKEQRSAWIPFSYGPRICIGMNFSLMEQKIFLATILREFSSIKLSENSVIEPEPKNIRPNCYKVHFYV